MIISTHSSDDMASYARLFKIIILLIFLSPLMISCTTGERETADHNKEVIDINLDAKKTVFMSEIFDEIRYLKLETIENRLVGNIKKILIQDDIIFLLENSTPSIFLYDLSGNYLNQVVINKGRGPEEMTSVSDFTVDIDQQQITVLGFQEIHTYTYEGHFVERQSLEINPTRLTVLPNGQLVFFMNSSTYSSGDIENPGYNLLYNSKTGFEKFLEIEKYKVNLSLRVPNNFPRYKEKQLFYSHPYYKIYELSPDTMSVRYTLDFGDYNVPSSLYRNRKNLNEGHKFLQKTVEGEYASYLSNFLETDSLIYFGIFWDRQKSYPVFYSKKESRSLVAEKLVNDIDGSLTPYFTATYDNELVAHIQPNDLLEKVEALKNGEENSLNKSQRELLEFADDLKPMDNSVIMFVE